VECLSRISFGEVRQLYQSARLVMNAVDDRYWPVGITTFCEALAMDRPIITSAGHSCSGYQFDDSSRPYWTVQDPFDTEQWVALVREVLALNGQRLLGASPRELALKLCSFNASVNAWSDIHRHATQDS
jgi:hypothetical protein